MNRILRVLIFILLITVLFSSAPVMAQSNETATNETATNETVTNETVIQDVDHEFQFSGVQLEVREKSLDEFVLILHNPTNRTQSLQVPGTRGEDTADIVQLRTGQTEQFNITPQLPPVPPKIYSQATLSEPIPLSEYESGGDVDNASFRITFEWISITMRPDTPSVLWEVFVSGLTPIIVGFAGYNYNLRWTRLAIAVNGPKNLSAIIDQPNYAIRDNDGVFTKIGKYVIQWVITWSLIVLIGVIQMWGFSRFIGKEFAGTYTLDLFFTQVPITIPTLLENSMVYMMYGQTIFFIMFLFGMLLAQQRFVELSDVNPINGDLYLYKLSPNRFAEMDVMCRVKFPSQNNNSSFPQSGTEKYKVDKSWLFENNKETSKKSYECIEYDMHNNVAFVPWSGQLRKLNPSRFRKTTRDIDYIMDTAIWAIDRYYRAMNDYVKNVQDQLGHLLADKTARLEGAETEGMGEVRERIEDNISLPNGVESVDNPLDAADEKHDKTGKESLDNSPSDPREQDVQTSDEE